MQQTVCIKLENQSLHFSVAHFTVFSKTERERLHGHNYTVCAEAKADIGDDGLAFDYNELKQALRKECQALDEYTLIAEQCPFLSVSENGDFYEIEHDGNIMMLLKSDTLLLPMRNITLEEMGTYFIEQLKAKGVFERLRIKFLSLEVASGPGQSVSTIFE